MASNESPGWGDDESTPAATTAAATATIKAPKAKKSAAPAVPADDPELRDIALKIFLDLRDRRRGMKSEALVAQAVVEARVFLDGMANADALVAEYTVRPDDGLDDACSPNLDPAHPFNLKSRRFGNADTLARYNMLTKPGNEEKYKAECKKYAPRNN